MNIFVEVLIKFFFLENPFYDKSKVEKVYLESCQHTFLDIEKKLYKKRSFRQSPCDLGQLKLLEILMTLQNWMQVGISFHGKYSLLCYEKCMSTCIMKFEEIK